MAQITTPPSVSPPPTTGAGMGTDEISLDATAAAPASFPATETTPVPTEERERERVRDPQLSVLQGMFPDFDEPLLQSVLDSVGGNSDRAIDVLLGMNDPDYRSEVRPQVEQEQPALSQEELDARFARQLYMEDQQQTQAAWEAQQQSRPRPVFNSGRRGSQLQQQEPERDTMTEIGDQFNKIAESGKKTFGNIFSKVKAKIAELDQSRQDSGAATPSQYTTGETSAGYQYQGSYPTTQQHRHQRMQQQEYLLQQQHQHQQQQQQQPAYYDPNATSDYSPPSSPGGHELVSGYEATPGLPRAGTANSPEPAISRSPPLSGGIDTGKLGLLPKRPVSLLRPQSPASSPPADGGAGHPTRISTDLNSSTSPAHAATVRQNSDADDLYADYEDYGRDPFDDAHAHGEESQTKAGAGTGAGVAEAEVKTSEPAGAPK
ncbi:hypothetical protein D9757_008238 [Collybiopsis confluens]|uniref:CUE domain-containing protein n=1 Tax=Collybiopsis confluens TaxID=2823264 RepID=A0A8H5HBR0_9AGAR|nr:hypothetical protein D9757_008238 [Collybiopsis confluens]